MFPSPLLFGAAFSGLLGTTLAATAEAEQCLIGSYVVFEVQPYEVVCGGSTSTSSVTKTYTLPFDPTATEPGKPGKPGSPPPPGVVTVTKPCGGENCSPGTYPPEPGCTECVVTVLTRTTVTKTAPTPDTTPTITIGCPDPDNCKPTTLYPTPGCTKTCTVTVITPPPSSVPTTRPPFPTVTTTKSCTDVNNCTPGTYPPASDCTTTTTCTATVITPPPSSVPTTRPPFPTVTITKSCTDANNCTPGTYPPASDCTTTTTCTATVITPPSSSASKTTPPVTSAPPPATVTITSPCTEADNCTPGTFPPASGCTTGTCTVTVVPPSSSSSSSASSTSSQPSSTSDIPSSTSSEASSTTTSETPGPTFDCDPYGYLIQGQALYAVNLTTGSYEPVNNNVGPGGGINAIGYNVKDNYIWGMLNSSTLIRINAAGDATTFPIQGDALSNVEWQTGDVDQNGILWASAGGSQWARIDVDQASPTFGQILDRGTSDTDGYTADWAIIPGGGRYLYAVQRLSATSSQLARWSMNTHQWQVLQQLGDMGGTNQFGAVYSAGNGIMYGSENTSGKIWKFDVVANDAPTEVTQGPSSTSNDGARCILASDPEFTGEP